MKSANRHVKHMRSVNPGDEAEVHQLLCVPQVYEYLADGVEPPPSIAADWISVAGADAERYGGGLWALTGPREQRVLGLVRLSDYAEGEMELTFLLHPDVWGSGFATRMAHTAMHHAFAFGAVSAIWAGADVPNAGSIAVLRRLGMQLRREVEYPAGSGVEYAMAAAAFDAGRVERLSIT
ncbi:MAG: GNAT family N-acetyltransferase [Pseudomonadota bacterium]